MSNPPILAPAPQHSELVEFLLSEIDKRTSQPPARKISEWVEGRRVMPSNTPFPGLWQNSRSPYAVEVMDNLSPHSPVQHTVVMKGAQLGLTAAAENIVGYFIGEYPAEVLFISASEELLNKWANVRLDPMIDSMGLRDRIVADNADGKSRRQADKVMSKRYIGGNLHLASAQSASSLRSDSKRILIRDEIDGAPRDLRTGEGSWLNVSYARTNAWGSRKKILDFSTPTTYAESAVYPEYEAGDQRKYFVPCPHCGEYQVLEWQPGAEFGLHPIMSDGRLVDAVYICRHCAGEIKNHHKTAMLSAGEWRPTAVPKQDNYRSYHISSLYSPVGMLSWRELYEKYLVSQDDPEGARWFTNLYLGMPYRETGARPKLEKILTLQGGYPRGVIPYGVLFLTMGIDVQRGSENDPKNPARLEAQIVGHGAGYRMWSIDYLVFPGDITDPYSGAWEKLNAWAAETGLTFFNSKAHGFQVQKIFIDAGDGTMTTTVEAFCERWNETYPIMGFNALKRRKNETADVDSTTAGDFKRYRMAKIGHGESWYYQISTNRYKQQIYNRINAIPRNPTDPQRPGFIDFPRDYDEKYFKMLTAEERLSDGSFHAGGRRNESLDTLVYAMCAADVYIDREVYRLSEALRRSKSPTYLAPEDVKRVVLQRLSDAAGVEFPYGQSEKPDESRRGNKNRGRS